MDLNSLQQYMDFAEKNGLFNQYKNIGNGSGFQPTQFNIPMMEANWARNNMGSSDMGAQTSHDMPNYFNFGDIPQGSQIGTNPYSARAQALQANSFADQPGRSSVMNYLARLLK